MRHVINGLCNGRAMSLAALLALGAATLATAQEFELPTGKVVKPTGIVAKSDAGCPEAIRVVSGIGPKQVPVAAFDPRSFIRIHKLKSYQYTLEQRARNKLLKDFNAAAQKKFRFHCLRVGLPPMRCDLKFTPAGADSAKVKEVKNFSTKGWTLSDLPTLRAGNLVIGQGTRRLGYVDGADVVCVQPGG